MRKATPIHRPRLLIFAKEPRPGRVKTRLGRDIGMVAAAGWYRRQALGLLRRMARDPRWETWVAVAPDYEGMASQFWPPAARRWPQGGGDLGARMRRAFQELPPGPVVIIGADIPDIGPRHVAEAFAALGSAEAVFGPADDGGYWLIGLRRGRRNAAAALLRGVRWSGEHALEDSLSSLGGERAALLQTLRDVDTVDDLPPREQARYRLR